MSTLPDDSKAGIETEARRTRTPPAPRPDGRTDTGGGRNSQWAAAKTVASATLVVFALFVTWGGIAPLTEPRDTDGYYMSDPVVVDRPSAAVVTTDMDLLRG